MKLPKFVNDALAPLAPHAERASIPRVVQLLVARVDYNGETGKVAVTSMHPVSRASREKQHDYH